METKEFNRKMNAGNNGFFWVNPFFSKVKLSLRARLAGHQHRNAVSIGD